jgi:Ca-activated chloride channel family protein
MLAASLVMPAASLVALWLGGAGPAGQNETARIVFAMPEDGAYASGPMSVAILLEPADTPVRSVTLFADGRLLCTLERPPFECPWDAGPRVNEHLLRAAVVLADGRRLARAIRTKGVSYVESVDVDAVHIPVSVLDSNGRFVRGLPREAFRLTERNVVQTISYFASENVPLEIIVAVDVSGSMTDAMPQVKRAVKTFLSALRPIDQVTLIGFNDNVFSLARPSADLAARLRAIDLLEPWGGTALYDVIVQAFDQLGRQPGRRVLVVFTDGEDLNSHIALSVAERRVEASDAVLYAIGQGRAPKIKELKTALERLSRKSGGRAYFDDLEALDGVFASILEELSNQYLLGFISTDTSQDGSWRPLTVELPGKSYRVRVRQGYRVEKR